MFLFLFKSEEMMCEMIDFLAGDRNSTEQQIMKKLEDILTKKHLEQEEYIFDVPSGLQDFLDQYYDLIVGHTLKAVFVNGIMYCSVDPTITPIVLVLDNTCLRIEFLYRSRISITTADVSAYQITGEVDDEDPFKCVDFHTTTPERTDDNLLWYEDMPFMNQKIINVAIEWKYEPQELSPRLIKHLNDEEYPRFDIQLEDGTVLHIHAERDYDLDSQVWFSDMPAYSSIKAELDKDPYYLARTESHRFDYIVFASNPTADELAELAMYYMRKCDHEFENYRKENEDSWPDSLYTFELHHVLEQLKIRGMNIDYVDSTGKALIDLALEIGDEACSRALPAIYYETMFSSSIARIARSMEQDYDILTRNRKDAAEIYMKLPQKVKDTSYGKKLLEFSKNQFTELKEKIDELRRDISALD